MHGFWPIFFLMVILKVPVGLLLYLCWWAFRAETQPEEAPPPESEDHRFGRFRREPKRPRGPRRGGHGPDAMPIPALHRDGRSRVTARPATARAAEAHGTQRGSAEPAES